VKKQKSYPIEIVFIGHQIKVTAIDPETGVEAVVICPENTSRKDACDLAVKKLHYVLAKQKAQ
jgi:hypothetical protein